MFEVHTGKHCHIIFEQITSGNFTIKFKLKAWDKFSLKNKTLQKQYFKNCEIGPIATGLSIIPASREAKAGGSPLEGYPNIQNGFKLAWVSGEVF